MAGHVQLCSTPTCLSSPCAGLRGGHSLHVSLCWELELLFQFQLCQTASRHCRDLKPENFLLATKASDAELKATDFGLSVFYKPGQEFKDIVGSAYYVAPEVSLVTRLEAVGLSHTSSMWGMRDSLKTKLLGK